MTIRPSPVARVLAVSAGLALMALVAACGGGQDAASQAAATATDAHPMNGVGSGGTGRTMSVGPVSATTTRSAAMAAARAQAANAAAPAVAAVTVNGTGFDVTQAAITDDQGATRPSSDLLLGTGLVVDAGPAVGAKAGARTVQITSDLIGAADGPYDAGAGRLSVLGQPVLVNASTAIDGLPHGLASIAAGTVLEVSSMYDALSGNYIATRLDLRPAALQFKVRGMAVGADARAKTFRVGSQTFSYAGVGGRVASGQGVAATLRTTRDASGRWVVTRFLAAGVVVPEGTSLGLSGPVVALSGAARFTVGGTPVDASHALVLPAGATVALHTVVQVQGLVLNGVLVASQVVVRAQGDGAAAN